MGTLVEDQAPEHHETQDGPRGEDIGHEGLSETDLQLCFMTLTPLYYRLKRQPNGSYLLERMRDSLWVMQNKLEMTEARLRFT